MEKKKATGQIRMKEKVIIKSPERLEEERRLREEENKKVKKRSTKESIQKAIEASKERAAKAAKERQEKKLQGRPVKGYAKTVAEEEIEVAEEETSRQTEKKPGIWEELEETGEEWEDSEEEEQVASVIPKVSLKIKLIGLLLMAGIFLVHVWGFWKYDVPIILVDEFFYWEHAAFFAGYDWSGVISHAPWYSFGYSLLLLPLFFVFEYMSSMYHAALLMNGAMAIGIYLTVRTLLGRLYPSTAWSLRMAIAAAVSLYPAYVGQSKIAWSEMAIYLTFWLLLLCLERLLETSSFLFCLLTSFLAGLTYLIHNRMLAIILALSLLAVLLKWTGRISWVKLQALLLPAAILYLGNEWGRNVLEAGLTQATGLEYGLNDVGNRIWKLKAFFTPDGIGHGIRTALGELVYVNMSTFTLGILGLCYVIRELFRRQGKDFFFLFFVALAFLGEWGISTLANMPLSDNIGEKLVTYLYYGRYVDAVLGVIIMFGLVYVLGNPSWLLLVKILLGNVVAFAVTLMIHLYSGQFKNELMKSMCIPGMWYADRVEGMNVIHFTLLIQAVTLLLLFGLVWKRRSRQGRILFCAAISVLFLVVGVSYSVIRIEAYQRPKEGIFRWAERNLEEAPVYCLTDEKAKYYAQAELYDRKIRMIDRKEIARLQKGCYLIVEKKLEGDNLSLCQDNKRYYIYQII